VCRNEKHSTKARQASRVICSNPAAASVVAGDTDAEEVAYIVDRYGEVCVCSTHLPRGSTWCFGRPGPLMLCLAGGIGLVPYLRACSRTRGEEQAPLSASERHVWNDILKD